MNPTRILTLLVACLLLAQTGFAQNAEYTPLKIIQTFEIVFPPNLVRQVQKGEARIALNVDEKGNLVDALVIGYSRKEFADLSMEGIRGWKYEPATLNGNPIPSVSEVVISFTATGVVVDLTIAETIHSLFSYAFNDDRYIYYPCLLKDIDRIPSPVKVIKPVYPTPLAESGVTGDVTVTFFIDETGEVRMPAVTKAADLRLAAPAIAALSQWKFEPPTRNGAPVLVRASQLFNFVKLPPKTEASKDTKS